MKNRLNTLLISTSIVALLATSATTYAGRHNHKHFLKTSTDTTTELAETVTTEVDTELSEEEIASLLFMREEEKLARDVYLTLYDRWGHPVFANIAKSEQQHMDAMAKLLNKYHLDDPVIDQIGVFTDPELAQMFVDLVEQGEKGLLEALYVGGLIEEVDMQDIQEGIEHMDEALIIRVYESLLRGSRNHLRAFVSAIEKLGVSYEPQVLDAEVISEITDSSMERG